MWLAGEAGIGKTTLIDAFVAHVGDGWEGWIGRRQCIEQYGAGEAYLPLLDACGRLGRALIGSAMWQGDESRPAYW